ncbi:MAG: hypothetical protein COA66_15935 [Arcobacter sp.]|nr:MAG: hypothetical protein COA66_15935 [Arcobacter sp.]
MNKKYIEIITSIFFIAFSVLLYGSADSVSLSVSQAATDSTSAYVNFIAILLGLSALVQLIISAISNSSRIEFTKSPKRFLSLIVSLSVYVFSMEYIGFIISTLIFLPITMRLMDYNKFIKSLIISIGITLFVYLLFEVGFEIILPEITIF